MVGSARHDGRAITGAFFAVGHIYSKVEYAAHGSHAYLALCVLVPLIPFIDRFHEMGECSDGLVDGGTSTDEDNNSTGVVDGKDKVLRRMVAKEGEDALRLNSVDDLIDIMGGMVVDGDWETFLNYVEGQVFTHHRQPRQSNS